MGQHSKTNAPTAKLMPKPKATKPQPIDLPFVAPSTSFAIIDSPK